VLAGEVVDASVMRVAALREFLTAQVARAKAEGVLFSVHLKATMMKVSDPIIFGHAVRAFFPKTFAEYGQVFADAGLTPNDGLGGILAGVQALPEGPAIKASFDAELAEGPAIAMVDSDRGITNLHVPSDVIVDASMPAMIRTSGHMWGPDGKEADTLAVLPDSSYAGVYQAVIDDCRAHGAFDPATMGSVPNVGLMAQKAEEYGSHDKTFEIPATGTSAWSTRTAPPCWSRRSAPATSSGCARPRTRRSRTGSSSPSPAPAPPATRRSSGWTRPARTTPS
jgi:isocitrate dehydrogenase